MNYIDKDKLTAVRHSLGGSYPRFSTFLFYGVMVLVVIFIFCLPFPYTTFITNASFYLAIIMAVTLILLKAFPLVVRTPLTWPLLVFFLWSCLSLIWALDFSNTLDDLRGHLLNYLILFFLLINFFNSKKHMNLLVWIVVVSAVVFSGVGIVYYYVIMGSSIIDIRLGHLLPDGRNVSTELPCNLIGALLIPAMLFCFYLYQMKTDLRIRSFIFFCGSIIFIASILTQSRATLLAIVVATTLLLLIKNKKKWLIGFLVLISLPLILLSANNRIMDSKSFLERLKINNVVLEVVKDNPLLGIGFGMRTFSETLDIKEYIQRISPEWKPVEIVNPHNWLLDMMLRVGIIGFISFLFIIFVFIKMGWKIIRHSREPAYRELAIYLNVAFLSYFLIGLFEPVFLFSASAIIFYVLMAMMTILWLCNRNENLVHNHDRTVV